MSGDNNQCRSFCPKVHLVKKRFLTMILACLLTLGVSTSYSSPADAGTGDDEALFISLVNQLRTGKGLQPLAPHPDLHAGAVTWTAVLSNNGELSHAPDLAAGVNANWAKLGENVGVASTGQTQQLFDAFVASPSHYANLVDPDFRYIGVAVVYDGSGRMWTTHRFMKLFEDPVATAPASTSPPATAAPASPTSTTAKRPSPTTSTTVAASTSTTESTEAPSDRPPATVSSSTPLSTAFVVAIVGDLAAAGI